MNRYQFKIGEQIFYKGEERTLINFSEELNEGYLLTTNNELGITTERVSLNELESVNGGRAFRGRSIPKSQLVHQEPRSNPFRYSLPPGFNPFSH